MKNIGTKKLFERKAYELFVPILIILLLGFITVSVGGLTNTRKEKSLNKPLYVANDNIIPISHNDVNPLEKTTLRQTDSIAALDKAPRKEYQVTPPALHLSRDGSAEKEK